ncbi:RNA helicase [Malassezia sp. CBS 17886]|nr:RNA helicase [Malassezia sp. CBS 17886]
MAKQRYLKAKKDRRRAKKAAVPKGMGEGKKKDKPRHQRAAKRAKLDGTHGGGSAPDEPDASWEDFREHDMALDRRNEDEDREAQASDAGETLGNTAAAKQPAATPKETLFATPKQTQTSDAEQLARLGVPENLAHATVVDAKHTHAVQANFSGDLSASAGSNYGGVALSAGVKRQLKRLGVTEWFAVQASVVPLLLDPSAQSHIYMPHAPPRDLCVSAPTGSGKTLAYAVPIVELLHTRILVQTRALILVPTRDLAMQVAEMFDAVGRGSGLHTATVTGSRSFRHEQNQLLRYDGERDAAHAHPRVDVVVATPGRLVDHILHTPGFSLQHLRFLVVDEADRLLGQSFQDWVPTLLAALAPQRAVRGAVCAPQDRPAEPAWAHDDLEAAAPSVQKLLFSATLTSDPAKINAIQLRDPHYVSVRDDTSAAGASHDRFALPATLREHMCITATSGKVLYLLRLLHAPPPEAPVRQALCFTKSVESATRLERLVSFFEAAWAEETGAVPLRVQYYSSDLGAAERTHILRSFQNGDIDLLICSDLIARGIDLPDVRHVISYDVPIDMAKYVHRVGRTARAGRSGDAWSLVEEQEMFHFKNMLRDAQHLHRIAVEKAAPKDWHVYERSYKDALAQLAQVYGR